MHVFFCIDELMIDIFFRIGGIMMFIFFRIGELIMYIFFRIGQLMNQQFILHKEEAQEFQPTALPRALRARSKTCHLHKMLNKMKFPNEVTAMVRGLNKKKK